MVVYLDYKGGDVGCGGLGTGISGMTGLGRGGWRRGSRGGFGGYWRREDMGTVMLLVLKFVSFARESMGISIWTIAMLHPAPRLWFLS